MAATTETKTKTTRRRGRGVMAMLMAMAMLCLVNASAAEELVVSEDLRGVWEENGKPNVTAYETQEGWDQLLTAVRDFEEAKQQGFVNPQAIMYSNEPNVTIWKPDLETLYYKGWNEGQTDDLTALFGTVLHEILSNMTFYGADVLVDDILRMYGLEKVVSAEGVMELIRVGLPSRDDMVVRAWETGFLLDAITELTQLMAEQKDLGEFYDEPFEGLILIFNQLVQDSNNMLWEDLRVILGDPLGLALLPVLNSSIAKNATNDPEGIEKRTEEIMPKLLEDFRSFATKNLLYNPYLPVPCLRGMASCPASMGAKDIQEFDQMYQSARNGTMSEGEFTERFQRVMFEYLAEDLGYDQFDQFVEDLLQQIFNNRTMTIVEALSQDTPPSNHQVDVLNSLAIGNYSLEIDQEVLETGFAPKTAVCLGNVSAAMFEYPDTMDAWTSGLGLEMVDSAFTLSGNLSPRGAVFVDKEQNAVVIGVEGTPYIHTYFLRGLFGWLRCIIQADGKAFDFPCEEEDSNSNSTTTMCSEMAEKYSDAWIYNGFAPFDSGIVDNLKPALDKAVAILQSSEASEFRSETDASAKEEKPTLYVTGHSLGGAIAKNTYAQVLLRGYDEPFSSVKLYASAGPVAGNDDYNSMIEEMTGQRNSMYQMVNSYDPIPYLPTINNVDKKALTAMYDVSENRLVKAEPLPPFARSPSNVYLSEFGYHAIKPMYLPLARSLDPDYDQANCERICSIEQCGRFKCPDTCEGVL
jgi:hypothetical protein